MGTIYLIQPAELIDTNRFKIGCSATNNLERCKKGYKKGSRYIIIMECQKPFEIEKEIKKVFNDKFKLIAGKEYFEGNEEDIKKVFHDTVSTFQLAHQALPSTFQTIHDVLRSNMVTSIDKKRIIQCYSRVKIWHETNDEEWDRGQLGIGNSLYRVNLDATITFVKDISDYTQIIMKTDPIMDTDLLTWSKEENDVLFIELQHLESKLALFSNEQLLMIHEHIHEHEKELINFLHEYRLEYEDMVNMYVFILELKKIVQLYMQNQYFFDRTLHRTRTIEDIIMRIVKRCKEVTPMFLFWCSETDSLVVA